MQFEIARHQFAKIASSIYLKQFVAVVLTWVAMPVIFFGIAKVVEFVRYPTTKEVEAAIIKQVPVGADKAKVVRFLQEHNFSFWDLPADEQAKAYSDFREPKIKTKSDLIKSYIKGRATVAEPLSPFGCWANITFYFDTNGKLLDSLIAEQCDAP